MLGHRQQLASQVGHGRPAYDKAVKAIMGWKQMELGWTTVQAESPKKGSLVCVLPHVTAIWMRLPLQVAFVSEGRCTTGAVLLEFFLYVLTLLVKSEIPETSLIGREGICRSIATNLQMLDSFLTA